MNFIVSQLSVVFCLVVPAISATFTHQLNEIESEEEERFDYDADCSVLQRIVPSFRYILSNLALCKVFASPAAIGFPVCPRLAL